MPVRSSRKPESQVRLARERIGRLFRLADKEFPKDPKLSDRYVRLAWKISLRYKVRLPPELRRWFCRKCLGFLVPGKTCTVRVVKGEAVVKCLKCGNRARYSAKKVLK